MRSPGVKRVWKVARGILLGLVLLITVPLLVVHALLLIPAVRELVSDKATAAASEALHAKVQLARLDALSIFHVRASGVRVLGAKNERLASLEGLTLDLNPFALVMQRLSITRLELDRPYADLGAPGDEGGGLLELFKSDQPEPEKPKSEPSKFEIALGALRVAGGGVDVKAAGAHYRVEGFDTQLRGRFGPSIALNVGKLNARVLRDGREVAVIKGDDMGYGREGEVRARLSLRSGQTAIAATAQLGAAGADGAQPLHARLRADDISAETLAGFGIDAQVLTEPVDLEAKLEGTTQALAYNVILATPGGSLHVDGKARVKERELEATLKTDGIEPQRFLDVAIAPVSALVRVHASQDEEQNAKLELDMERGTYSGGDLPRLQVNALRNAAGDLWLDRLDARYPQGSLTAKGRRRASGDLVLDAKLSFPALAELPPVRQLGLAVSGALQGDVELRQKSGGTFAARSNLQLTKARFDTVRADALTLAVEAHGAAFNRPAVVLELHASEFNMAKTHLPRADVTVAGGPEHYFIAGRFGELGGLQTEITREEHAIGAKGHVSVAIEKEGKRRPLRADIDALRYADNGALEVRGVRVSYRDAKVSLEGALDPRRSGELRARADIPHLGDITELVMKEPIEGAIGLQANVSGSLNAPKLRASASYKTKALYGLKNLAVDLDVNGDVPARKVALMLRSRSHAGRIEATLNSELRSARLDAAAFTEGRHDASVRFDRFAVSELSMWPRETVVPIDAELSGEVGFKGRMATPELRSDLRSTMKFGGDAGKLELSARGSYAKEHLALDLDAADRRGPLMRTRLQTDLTRRRVSRDPDFVKRLLRERSWEASIWLGGRRIDELPVLRAMNVPEAALPAQLSAQFDLAHSPGKEPEGRLRMSAVWDPPGDINAKQVATTPKPAVPKRCGVSNHPRFDLDVRMQEGELHSELVAKLEGKPAMVVRTESHAPIDEWFQAQPKRLQPAGVAVQFSELRLSKLPVACEFVDGSISGHAEISRAVTEKVSASVDLHASTIKWGEAPPFDASISATADRQALDATTKLTAANGNALIATKLPLEGRGRIPGLKFDAPAFGQIKIHDMDVRALLAPVPNVRASAGKLNTDLTLTGTISNPNLDGKVELSEVTVTLAELGQRVERVTGSLVLKDRSVTLERLKVHDRDGTADLSGKLTMPSLGTFQGEVNVTADNFPVRKTGVMLARFDGTANLKANVDPKKSRFDLTLHRARIELTDEDMGGVQTLRTNPEIVFSDAGQHEVIRVEQNASTPLTFNIDASEPFWVTRSDFSVLVATRLTVEAAEGPVSVTGTVDLNRGYVELIGQSFDIERGHIEFTGGREVEPTLDLVANKRVPGGKKVTIKATGTLAQPALAFFVDDAAVTAGEALSAASGSRSSGSDQTVQQQVSSMATGLAAGVLTLGARRELGEWMPVLSIDAGENGPSVRAGIEADRFIPGFLRKVVVDAYVEGILSSGGDSSKSNQDSSSAMPAALLELRFPHDLVGEAQYGPGQRFSVDVGWEP